MGRRRKIKVPAMKSFKPKLSNIFKKTKTPPKPKRFVLKLKKPKFKGRFTSKGL